MPLTRYAKLRVAPAPGMPGTFNQPSRVSDPDMHHGTCVTHLRWSMSELLTSGFRWSRWRGKRSRHSRRMHNPQFCVSGKRLMLYAAIEFAKQTDFSTIWFFYNILLDTLRACPAFRLISYRLKWLQSMWLIPWQQLNVNAVVVCECPLRLLAQSVNNAVMSSAVAFMHISKCISQIVDDEAFTIVKCS